MGPLWWNWQTRTTQNRVSQDMSVRLRPAAPQTKLNSSKGTAEWATRNSGENMKKVFLIFVLSFFLNLIWENLHSLLYINYLGGKISELILVHATLGDAIIITLLCLPFIYLPNQKQKSWLIIPLGVLIAISVEIYALRTGMWAYNEFMPIIPLLKIGLTPTIQLGLLGYLTYWLVEKKT